MLLSDFRIQNLDKLDGILVDLCSMVVKGQRDRTDLGMVAAAVLDPDNRCVSAINYPTEDGSRVHAERAAMDAYMEQYGDIPAGSIIITTLSPCTEYHTKMANDRYGESCTDLINQSGVHKVYAGYADPSQDETRKKFHVKTTTNPRIRQLCKAFADTFLKDQLDELSFLGSQCTKDCSGHRAGYEWSKRKGLQQGNSPWSPSFNKGAALAVAGK
jgi:pyrimidine deaminase RibD-like protein